MISKALLVVIVFDGMAFIISAYCIFWGSFILQGVDKTTGKAYEDLFCSNVTNYGVAILGDSAAAHFSLPRAWFSAVEISPVSVILLKILDHYCS